MTAQTIVGDADASTQADSLMNLAAELRALLAGASGALSSSEGNVQEFAGPLLDLARDRAEALHRSLDGLAVGLASGARHG